MVLALLLGACADDRPSTSPDPAPDAAVDAAPAADAAAPEGWAIEVDTAAVVAEVDRRFLSFALDTSQVVGGNWWQPGAMEQGSVGAERVPPFDFDRPRLHALTAPLAPAFLRIGGSEADRVFYALDGAAPDPLPEGYEFAFTAEQLAGVGTFAQALGLDLYFTLNAGPGPRDEARVWQPDEARALIEHVRAAGWPVAVWELGNEINGYPLFHGFGLTPEAYAADLATARALLDEVDPAGLLAGPSSAYWPVTGELAGVLPGVVERGADSLDIISWHYYPQQSARCPLGSRRAGLELMLDPANLAEIDRWADEVEGARDAHAPGVPVWLGESGNAQCGGAPGISDRFASTFWWLDQLGRLARRGQPVVVRQTLVGSDYGLIGEFDLMPKPDWWASVLFKRLMDHRVLAAQVAEGPDTLRVYAHCHPQGGVTGLLINVDAAPVTLHGAALGARREVFRLTGALDADQIALEGRPLALTDDDGLPSLAGTEGMGAFEVAGRSVAFVRWPDAPGCTP